MAKTIADSYLYTKFPDYNKKIVNFIVKANRIDTRGNEFSDILFDIKRRRISDKLSKIITSPNVVIGISPDGVSLPKALRVFVAKDLNDKNKMKVFIDGTDFIKYENGNYYCKELNWLISYTLSAMIAFVYKMMPAKVLLNQSVITDGCETFTRLFSFIIDRIYKVTSVQDIKKGIDYSIALYYQFNLLDKDFTSESAFRTAMNNAVKISGISSRDAQLLNIKYAPTDFTDINAFTSALARNFNFKDFKIDVFVSMWISSYGTGTPFALEFLPSFCMMATNTYIGGYLDNQNMIEKISGPALIAFCKTLLKIGDDVA